MDKTNNSTPFYLDLLYNRYVCVTSGRDADLEQDICDAFEIIQTAFVANNTDDKQEHKSKLLLNC